MGVSAIMPCQLLGLCYHIRLVTGLLNYTNKDAVSK